MDKNTERKKKLKRINRILDRIAGFIIVTVLAIGIGGLGLVKILSDGPSPAMNTLFINMMQETRRFDFIPHLFLTNAEIEARDSYWTYMDTAEAGLYTDFDPSMITITETKTDSTGMDAYGLIDDDGDGIIFQEIHYHGSTGYMIIVLDPTRVFVGMPDKYGGYGLTLEDMIAKYDALGGINAGGFIDVGGAGNGGYPDGITIVDGVTYNASPNGGVVGLDSNGLMYVGYYSIEDCEKFGIVNAVSFSPVIIQNGEKLADFESGINPRTAIGQRGDGAIVMLCVDGRQAYSFGVTYEDTADIMLSYGVMNAINMDGGSSTCMYYNGGLANSPTNAAGGTRYLPTAWLFK